jgi:hypothetical protein
MNFTKRITKQVTPQVALPVTMKEPNDDYAGRQEGRNSRGSQD